MYLEKSDVQSCFRQKAQRNAIFCYVVPKRISIADAAKKKCFDRCRYRKITVGMHPINR